MSSSGPALVKGEVEGIVDLIIKRAKAIQRRNLFISMSDLNPKLHGPDHEQKINRIRWKMAKDLKKAGILIEFKGNGYKFTIDKSIDIEKTIPTLDDIKPIEGKKQVQTQTKWVTTYIPPPWFYDVYEQVKLGRTPLFVGPKGCGKSRAAEEILTKMGLKTIRIAMGEIKDPVDLIGTKEVVNDNGVPTTKFVGGLITEANEKGWGVVLDEVDSVPSSVGLVLNKILEEGSTLTLLTEHGVEEMGKHKNFRVIATANTWGTGDSSGFYAGTEIQNSATMDRFWPKQPVGYDYKIERQLVKEYLPQKMVDALYNTGSLGQEGIIIMIRKAIADPNSGLDDICGLRPILRFAQEYERLGWHKSWFYFVQEFREEYRDAICKMITDRFGEDFIPTQNDYDQNEANFIPKLMEKVIAAGF